MAKEKIVFFCKECGYESSKWLGKCPACNTWNSFIEEKIKTSTSKSSTKYKVGESTVKKLNEIQNIEKNRLDTGYEELNRVLGRWLSRWFFSTFRRGARNW